MSIAGYVCKICGSSYERIEKGRSFSPGCPKCGSAKVMRSADPIGRVRKIEPNPLQTASVSRRESTDRPT